MSFELNDIKELFELNLNPIRSDIKELKIDQKELRDDQKKIIEIISIQSKHSVLIDELKGHIKECKEDRLRIVVDREKMTERGNNRWFDFIKLLVAAILGAIISRISNLWN